MKKILLLLMALLVTVGCRSRKKSLEIKEYHTAQIEKIDTDTTRKAVQTEVLQAIEKNVRKEFHNQQLTHVKIKGKVDSIRPFTYHNIVSGDTLADIVITGNAQFEIVHRAEKLQRDIHSETIAESKNLLEHFARSAVSQETIKKSAEFIKEKAVAVKNNGFGVMGWIVIIVGGILVIALAALIIYAKL